MIKKATVPKKIPINLQVITFLRKLLEEHSKKLAKHLQKNEGIWLSSFWTKIMMSFFIFYTILLLIYAYIK